MRLLLLRHGATAGNALKRYVGARSDEPLSEEGRAQCLRAGHLPDVDYVYASPLARAQETARLCFPHATIRTVSGLEEYDFGAFEGRTADEMEYDSAYRTWVDSGCTTRCPGGDSRASFMARSNAALIEVLSHARESKRELAVVVAHGGTIMAALHAFAVNQEGDPIDTTDLDYFKWHVGNAQGYVASAIFQGEAIALANPQRVTALGQDSVFQGYLSKQDRNRS